MKPKEETKTIEDKSHNQSKAETIFNKLVNGRKDLMKELHASTSYNNLKFDFIGPTKDVNFYEYRDSKELFSVIKNNQINFDDVLKRQKGFLKRLSSIKIGKRTIEIEKRLIALKNFLNLEMKLLIFYGKIILDATCKSKENKT